MENITTKKGSLPNIDDYRDTFPRRFAKNIMAVIGVVVMLLLFFTAVFAPKLAPYDPYELSGEFAAAPSKTHLLGTDLIGRDVLSRLIYASRISLVVGLGVMLCSVLIGVTLGLISGYFGGVADTLIMRAADIIMTFPSMMLIIVLVSVVGPGLENIILILGFQSWPQVARLVRGRVLSIKELNYIKASKVLGFSTPRILFRHVLPNTIVPILINATFRVSRAILTESSLSFLGLGIQPPTSSWGNMLTDAQSLSVLETKVWLWLPPCLMVLICVLATNFIGEGLRDATDPRRK